METITTNKWSWDNFVKSKNIFLLFLLLFFFYTINCFSFFIYSLRLRDNIFFYYGPSI